MKSLGPFLATLALIALITVFGSQSALASWNVWTDDLIIDKPRPDYNPTAPNTSITIKGAKGEWLAFYVLARPAGENLNSFVPSVQTSLKSGSNTIADANWTFYMVQMVTTTSSTYIGGSVGAWPDPCVPYKDRFYGEIRNGAQQGWGKTVTDSNTQPFLAEIFIPPTTPPGTYTGVIALSGTGSQSGSLTQNIPVSLQVWNFSVPLSWTYGSTFGMDSWAPQGYLSNVFPSRTIGIDLIFRSCVDHGVWPYLDDSGPGIDASTGAATFTGGFADPMYGYGPWLKGVKTDNPNNPRPYYGFRPAALEARPNLGPVYSVTNGDATKIKKYFDDWGTYISTQLQLNYNDVFNSAQRSTYFVSKTFDEAPTPDCCAGQVTRTDMTATGSSFPYMWPFETVGASLGCFPWAGSCPASGNDVNHQLWTVSEMMGFARITLPSQAASGNAPRQNFDPRISSPGDKVWLYTANAAKMDYNAHGQDSAHVLSSWSIDTVLGARENAATSIAMWPWRATGYHYYAINIALESSWQNLKLGDPEGIDNGDGSFFYPGYGSSAHGYDIGGTHTIPVESLRLKLWRYGMYVLEYAELLKSKGNTDIADAQIAQMYAPTPSQGTTWGSVDSWRAAREAMANAISEDTTPPPANRTQSTPIATVGKELKVLRKGKPCLIRQFQQTEFLFTPNATSQGVCQHINGCCIFRFGLCRVPGLLSCRRRFAGPLSARRVFEKGMKRNSYV